MLKARSYCRKIECRITSKLLSSDCFKINARTNKIECRITQRKITPIVQTNTKRTKNKIVFCWVDLSKAMFTMSTVACYRIIRSIWVSDTQTWNRLSSTIRKVTIWVILLALGSFMHPCWICSERLVMTHKISKKSKNLCKRSRLLRTKESIRKFSVWIQTSAWLKSICHRAFHYLRRRKDQSRSPQTHYLWCNRRTCHRSKLLRFWMKILTLRTCSQNIQPQLLTHLEHSKHQPYR